LGILGAVGQKWAARSQPFPLGSLAFLGLKYGYQIIPPSESKHKTIINRVVPGNPSNIRNQTEIFGYPGQNRKILDSSVQNRLL